MTTTTPPNSHLHFFNHHTGRPRFHFDATSDAAAAAAAAASAAKPWHDGVEAETLGHWQNKGWKVDDPKEIAVAATKQARELEKHFGVPADRLLKMPGTDAKPEEISAFRQRIGVPVEAKDYDFAEIKDAKGQPLAQPLADMLRASFHVNGVTKDAAPAVARDVVKHLDSVKTTQDTLLSGNLDAERAELEKNWGGKGSATYKFNKLQAVEGARKLGLDEAALTALESLLGYPKTMDALRKIGGLRREDVFVETQPGGGPGNVTTREGAVARKAELMADRAWGKRVTAGDAEARRELDQLNKMIVGDAA